MKHPIDYNLFLQFFESYKSQGFKNIDPTTPQVAELEEKMIANRQFLIIGDVIQFDALHASRGYYDFFGQIPAESYPLAVYNSGHPDITVRYNAARAKLFTLGQNIFNRKFDKRLLSTNLAIKNCHGNYIDLMFQCYLVYSEIPYPSAFVLMVHTDITEITQIKHRYHFYEGPEISYFRFPDEQLLMTGHSFTKREFEIINCIAEGLDSQQIAEKLFLSTHTISTHRRNILNKTEKRTTYELVIELRERGVI